MTEDSLSKLNYLLKQQDTICNECRSISEKQSSTVDLKEYTEQQTVLNNLFLQYMELCIQSTEIMATEGSQAAEPVEDCVLYSVRVGESSESTADGITEHVESNVSKEAELQCIQRTSS